MNLYEFYIQPQEYSLAESVGIKPKTLEKRIRGLAWDKRKAITTPTRPKRDLTPYYQLAEQNGIPRKTFNGRMRRSWEPMRAATQPIEKRGESLNKRWDTERKYPKECVQKAKENGVTYREFQWRMKNGWSLKEASETKLLTKKEASSRAYSKSTWKTGPSMFIKKGVKA